MKRKRNLRHSTGNVRFHMSEFVLNLSYLGTWSHTHTPHARARARTHTNTHTARYSGTDYKQKL